MSFLLSDPKIEALLDRMHTLSETQDEETDAYLTRRERAIAIDQPGFYDEATHRFLSDKMVALQREKAEFCYLLCRSMRAARIVEAGTSFGVSTLYLAAAVRDNQVANGLVIGTEHEPEKIRAALANFKEAGLSDYIDLLEGDLRNTLARIKGPIDFMLVDIWDVARPALELVSPLLRPGAVVVCDNTAVDRAEYGSYFEFVHDPRNRFKTMTMPFQGGFELSVRI